MIFVEYVLLRLGDMMKTLCLLFWGVVSQYLRKRSILGCFRVVGNGFCWNSLRPISFKLNMTIDTWAAHLIQFYWSWPSFKISLESQIFCVHFLANFWMKCQLDCWGTVLCFWSLYLIYFTWSVVNRCQASLSAAWTVELWCDRVNCCGGLLVMQPG